MRDSGNALKDCFAMEVVSVPICRTAAAALRVDSFGDEVSLGCLLSQSRKNERVLHELFSVHSINSGSQPVTRRSSGTE